MRAILFILLSAVFISAAHAEAPAANEVESNIHRGNIAVGGGFALGYSKYSKVLLSLYPRAEYFIADRISIGGSVSYSVGASQTAYGVGPAASYYFWESKQMSALAGLGLLYNHYHNSGGVLDLLLLAPRVGYLYFPVRYISFGPVLQVNVPLDKVSRDSNSDPSYGLTAAFNVYF